MNKVLSINLAGRAFSVEEAGYDSLRAYLDGAEHSLSDNPDKTEIIADIEAALAEKCATYLNTNKNVVTSEEARTIVKEMGPVAGSGEAPGATQDDTAATGSPKCLYRIRQGEWIFGVCNGLAAYFDVDVTLVRIIVVLLTIFTSGGFCLAYFLMMLVIPEANTPQERAASIGGIPTAQELIDRAKKEYERFANSGQWHHWKHKMKEEHHQWKREQRRQWRYRGQWWSVQRSPFWEFMNSLLGLVWFVLILALCWWSYNHVPVAHEFFDQLPVWGHDAANWISHKI